MHTLLRYPAGVIVEGIIVRQTRTRMRVLAPGFTDVLELKHVHEGWIAENGDRFEFDFIGAAEGRAQAPVRVARAAR